jgi:hypothetical protein
MIKRRKKMDLKVSGMRRVLLSRGRIQVLPEGTHEEKGFIIAGFPRPVLERAPPQYKFGKLLLHRVMENFL